MIAAAIMLLLGVGVYTSHPVAEFRAHSNHNSEYAFAYVKECESGLRDSGYALAPLGTIVLKQINKDGSVGDVCTD